MPGNLLGARRYYAYTSDTEEEYSILTDQDLGTAAGLTLDDTNPPVPRRFKPRGVYAQATVAGKVVRKFLVCEADSPLYTDSSSTVSIDGVDFKTTGRRGESASFGSNPAA